MSNPLVAGRVDTATPFSGAGLLDSGAQLADAISSGNWIEGGIGAVSVAVDTAATVIDPLGSLIGAGLGWLMDHFDPLKSWLNDFAGDAGEVAGFAQTWANIAEQMHGSGDELVRVLGDVDELAGEAMDAYRRFQADAAAHLHAAGSWAGAMGTGLQIASTIVQIIHDLVRDAIAQLVGSVISWAAEAVFTLGLATPVIVGQVTTRVASLSARVGKFVTKVIDAIRTLSRHLDELKALFRRLSDLIDTTLKGAKPATRAAVEHGASVPRARIGQALSAEELSHIRTGGYSMAWFDDVSRARYYDVPAPKLGASGRPFFVMPAEDGEIITTVGDAARYTGMSPATERALINQGDVYAIVFPKGDIPHTRPTELDARGAVATDPVWPHFLAGGHTAVRLSDAPTSGYLVNPTREYVIPGATPIPDASMLLRLSDGGSLIVVRRF